MPLSSLFCALRRSLFPEPLQRPAGDQAAIDRACGQLALYHYPGCPYCYRVKRALTRLNLKVEPRDVNREPHRRNELLSLGGQMQVPCLRITEGEQVSWLYESGDIVAYLNRRFGQSVGVTPT